ncbi:uncharacterized protein LOC128254656 [Drosophila gunungcola]|uniref:Minus n=1 Tax=Drosophila gunungcola TaxID=103775 RepID=A0A9P9YKY4_9MUSC|nr:uncharacterized protein LOC128254656 [Drosophila gunungcola]XP_052839817.1 uncharacterized protein LOC128254656 [Drosophila gunungcola]KAI8038498.1 hypothetical protein M5D96_008397 [Drosophila gunungcola]
MATSNSIRNKINNSYESEPSTGSGSSLSENNEGHISDEEHMNLPYLMKPKPLSNQPVNSNSIAETPTPPNQKPGSQESQFLGFGDSPYGQVNKRLYGSQLQNLKLPEVEPPAVRRPSPGKIVFPRFYDTLIEENSCNAVDMAVSVAITSTTTTGSLSFDGKIKSLTVRPDDQEKPGPSNANPRLATVLDTSLNTSQHKFNNERSPDLFADSDEEAENDDQVDKEPATRLEDLPEVLEESQCTSDVRARCSLTAPTESSFVDEQTMDLSATQLNANDPRSHFLENCRRERELYRRIRRCLQGVRPPPTVTTPDVDVIKMVLSMKSNVLNFLSKDSPASTPAIEDSGISETSSLFRPTHSLSEAQNMGWRDVLGVRHHGLSYNLNKAAEQNEYLSMSVVDRYVGVETATSYVRSPSSAKKRNMRMKMLTQSPGNRLSHLAKRRAIFSSANLATNSLKLNSSIGPQLMVDKKKARNKRKATPKRKTPGSKTKARKTPSSSARKRLYRTDLIKPGPSRETSKRALFQSPAKSLQQQQLMPPKPLFKPEIANRVERSKRALFSPDNQGSSNQLESLLKRKRNACDDEDSADLASQSSKLFRAESSGPSGLTPRALKIKSQSFCIGAGSSTAGVQLKLAQQIAAPAGQTRLSLGLSGSSSNLVNSSSFASGTPLASKLLRAHSEMSATPNSSMTDNQRKKLLWAVSQALQERKITAKHELFRQHAADLTRIVKRIFQEFYLGHSSSNSETLLRLAKKFAFSVIAGKNADDVYLQARSQESEAKRLSSTRLSGYIGPEEFAQRKMLLSQASAVGAAAGSGRSLHNLFGSENSIDSFGLSQMSLPTNTCSDTQSSIVDRISEDLFCKERQPIRPNPTLQNSSSKSNLGGLALRENMDCETRRSAQKNFTGKDQQNISPYFGGGGSNGSARKFQMQSVGNSNNSGGKAKRQISFDC